MKKFNPFPEGHYSDIHAVINYGATMAYGGAWLAAYLYRVELTDKRPIPFFEWLENKKGQMGDDGVTFWIGHTSALPSNLLAPEMTALDYPPVLPESPESLAAHIDGPVERGQE